MKIKFPSPAQMIDDGEGRHRFWGKGEKQPENAWKWEMLTQDCCAEEHGAASCPTWGLPGHEPVLLLTPLHPGLCPPREGCLSPWPLAPTPQPPSLPSPTPYLGGM